MLKRNVWRKSTRSGPWTDNCQEAIYLEDDGLVATRNTKDRGGVTLFFSVNEWRNFIDGVKNNEFDI